MMHKVPPGTRQTPRSLHAVVLGPLTLGCESSRGKRPAADSMTPPPIRLLSTDFDGTLFAEFEAPPVPHALQELIGQLQAGGVTWVINTGRDMAALMECLGRAHLTIRPNYLVLVEREIYRHEDTRYVGVQAWNDACRHEHDLLFKRVRHDLPALLSWINERFDATLYEDGYSPLCLVASNNDDANTIVDHLELYCRSVPGLTVVRNDVYARFSHEAFSKGTALAEIQRRLGIQPEHTLAVGDHYNDLTMLSAEVARHLIAPANAIEKVRTQVLAQGGRIATQPCGRGVLEGLEHLLTQHGWAPN